MQIFHESKVTKHELSNSRRHLNFKENALLQDKEKSSLKAEEGNGRGTPVCSAGCSHKHEPTDARGSLCL